MKSDEARGFALIGSGAVLLGTASILVRIAFPISALEVAFGRLAVAAVFVAAIAFFRSELRGWIGDARPYSLFGAIMALHFITFVGSLALTSIAHSLSIVYLAPAIIAIASVRVLGERLRPAQIAGIGLSIVGIAVLTGFERQLTMRMFAGDVLAFASAVFFAAYSIIGRIRRASMPVFAYTSRVYVWAAIWALPFAPVRRFLRLRSQATIRGRGRGPSRSAASFPSGSDTRSTTPRCATSRRPRPTS